MKRQKLERHLRKHGCRFVREGGNHSIWENPVNGSNDAGPRHREVSDRLIKSICKTLDIPAPTGS